MNATNKHAKMIVTAALVGMLLTVATSAHAPQEAQNSGLDQNRMSFGLSSSVIEGDVNKDDVLVAVRL